MTDIFNEINNLTLFSEDERNALISRIQTREVKGKQQNFVECLVRKKEIVLTPEEAVRQLYLARLINDYGYETSRIKLEHAIHFGREVKRADIVIFEKERPTTEYIVVELKKDKEKEGKEQLKSYCNATGASIAIWTNGSQITYYNRKDPNYFEDITEIPTASQTLKDILDERFTLKDLIIKDKILKEGKTLKQIILDMEDEVLANAGVDVFEECFKLIFTKLYDEMLSKDDKTKINWKVEELAGDELKDLEYSKYLDLVKQVDDSRFRGLEFRNKGETDLELKKRIQDLFDKAKEQWRGVFTDDAKINLSPSHLSVCVSSIQDVKLFNSNLQVIDEAFEYLVSKSAKGEKGQYFTPRHVIDMCVKMLNPKGGEHMIDTASGSCGFPVHTIFKITGKLFSNADIPAEEKDNILKIFGIDFDEKVVRVSRTLNLIAGDGNTNVLHLNTLDYDRWDENTKSIEWNSVYGDGFKRLKKLETGKDNKTFKFELLMANPPFAGDIKESRILTKYDLAFSEDSKGAKKAKNKVGRDILFIERNLDFVRPGGRLAIVLPQGRFNNTSDKDVREYIADKARILAVVGLDVNTFKPHTGTKTSVIFLQKWNDDNSDPKYYCPHKEDYPIFFAVSEKSGKDNSGEYVYIKEETGRKKTDKHGHFIVDHDLHNQNGELSDGIAEAFIEFARSENLSFWSKE